MSLHYRSLEQVSNKVYINLHTWLGKAQGMEINIVSNKVYLNLPTLW